MLQTPCKTSSASGSEPSMQEAALLEKLMQDGSPRNACADGLGETMVPAEADVFEQLMEDSRLDPICEHGTATQVEQPAIERLDEHSPHDVVCHMISEPCPPVGMGDGEPSTTSKELALLHHLMNPESDAKPQGAAPAKHERTKRTDTARPSSRPVTTVCVRHIPLHWGRDQFVSEMNRRGFAGKYDYIYIPVDVETGQHSNYAIVNVTQPAHATELLAKFPYSTPAKVQGFARNLLNFVKHARCKNPLYFPVIATKSTPQGEPLNQKIFDEYLAESSQGGSP